MPSAWEWAEGYGRRPTARWIEGVHRDETGVWNEIRPFGEDAFDADGGGMPEHPRHVRGNDHGGTPATSYTAEEGSSGLDLGQPFPGDVPEGDGLGYRGGDGPCHE